MMTSFELPECFGTNYCIQYFFFCKKSLVRDTNLHNKACSEMHSGTCSQMTSSCRCPLIWMEVIGGMSDYMQYFQARVVSTPFPQILHFFGQLTWSQACWQSPPSYWEHKGLSVHQGSNDRSRDGLTESLPKALTPSHKCYYWNWGFLSCFFN